MSSFIWDWISSMTSHMNITSWYAFTLVSFLLIWIFIYGVRRLFISEWLSTSLFFLKHFVYPHVLQRVPYLGTATRFETLLCILYLGTNIFLVTIGITSSADVGVRTATMSVINLIPLVCGPRLILLTKLLGISLRTSIGSHQWFGRTAVAQAIMHTILSFANGNSFIWTKTSTSGVIASSAFALILVLSLHILRRTIYEFFINSHLILSIIVFVALWRHLPSKKPAEIILRIGIYLWVVATSLHWFLYIFRNFVFGKPFAKAKITQLSMDSSVSILKIEIAVPRPWRVQAGQYIFLSIPALGWLSGMRGHPFMISWWDQDCNGLNLSLIVKPQNGFTQLLNSNTDKELQVFIDGPYGTPHDFGQYGTIIMFATGIGIAGHMGFIKDLIHGHINYEVRTRHVILAWEIENENQVQWVRKWMQDLMNEDRKDINRYILKICLYNKRKNNDSHLGTHDRIEENEERLSVTHILDEEFKNPCKVRRGKILVSVCAESVMADKIRFYIQQNMDQKIRLVELNFKPGPQTIKGLPKGDLEFGFTNN